MKLSGAALHVDKVVAGAFNTDSLHVYAMLQMSHSPLRQINTSPVVKVSETP